MKILNLSCVRALERNYVAKKIFCTVTVGISGFTDVLKMVGFWTLVEIGIYPVVSTKKCLRIAQ